MKSEYEVHLPVLNIQKITFVNTQNKSPSGPPKFMLPKSQHKEEITLITKVKEPNKTEDLGRVSTVMTDLITWREGKPIQLG